MSQAPYRYTECGLESVLIHGIVPHIDDEGDEVITIPHINALHKVIAAALVQRPGLLTGKEIRFLRTEIGMTQAELAQLVHKEALSVGRWERGEVLIDANAETLLRLMVAQRLDLNASTSVEAVSRLSVQTANPPPIEIDGTDPNHYKQAA